MALPESCPECRNGTMTLVVEEYRTRSSDGNEIAVPEVELYRCESCGETIVPRESGRRIKEFKAAAAEQLSPRELRSILDRSGLTQKDFAEALGLGEKTLHRWLKGTQTVSRSMGYYLRSMDRFPEVFGWIKHRAWREAGSGAYGDTCRTSGLRDSLVAEGQPDSSAKVGEGYALSCESKPDHSLGPQSEPDARRFAPQGVPTSE